MTKTDKILHICSNYISTKLFPNLLFESNKIFRNNYLFCPIKKHYKKSKYSYLNSEDSILKANADYVKIEKCYSKFDTLLFYPKRSKIFKKVKKSYNLNDYEAIMAHSLFTDGWVARKLFLKFGLPYCVFVQNSDINVFLKKFFFLRKYALKILEDARKIVFCSETVKKNVFDKYLPATMHNAVEQKTVIIPFGIENTFFDDMPKAGDIDISKSINVVTVGSIDENKNQIAVACAIDKLIKEKMLDVKYVLAGNIVEQACLDKLLKYPFVNYLGTKNYDELKKIYADSDIFALTSRHETFGLVYAEAMTRGLPLIYSRGQGFDGQFADGEVGYAVNCDDIDEIASALEKIISEYAKLSKNALEGSLNFKWDKVARAYHGAIICSE